ncbi:SNF2-like helicase [Indivirus ILV1]|uniref:SNF2-like helicase n=1 Tax=Indivirus ILV1 TaxID=1977633 RepID=A0A1V0SDN6_9VIRU|nr:SNF2-like helicase [Indivirus ILV1]
MSEFDNTTEKLTSESELMKIDYTYPETNDKDLQNKIYKKREFYYNKIPDRPEFKDYEEIHEFRNKICAGPRELLPQQAFLVNLINPHTNYRGILVMHGTGVGKCVTGDSLVYVNGNLMPIKKIWDRHQNEYSIREDDGSEWRGVNMDLYVNSYNENEKVMAESKITKLYRQPICEKIQEIILDNGLKIKMTLQHRMLTATNNWSNNLKIGDYVCIPKYLINTHKSFSNILDNETLQSMNQETILPNFIMDADKDAIINFLRYYFDKHGIINKSNGLLYIVNKSSIIIMQLYCLLKLFGIRSVLDDSNRILYLTCENLKSFIEIIGLPNKNKYNILKTICDMNYHESKTDNMEYIRIKSIKYVQYNGYVYDLEIEDYHNYIVNGILTHNTCAAISIAEQFKPMVQKYGTKIHVLVPGPLMKENWKTELLKCTGETYMKYEDATVYINEAEKQKAIKIALNSAMQYYRFMSYRSFYKKVLGEKIREQPKTGEKVKAVYRKTEEGEFERDISIDRIYNLNNTLLIIDEAHNLTGNAYGEALMKIIKNSYNLRIVCLTATPMKNLGDDIVELLNFLRPHDSPIIRDKIFSSHKNHEMIIKPGGIEYLKKMSSGYVSYLRGADPLTFAKRIDKGIIPPGLLFTKMTRCSMLSFQRKIYDETIKIVDDTLDRRSGAVSNFAFPGLDDSKKLTGYYSNDGIDTVKNQLKVNLELINKKIALEILKDKNLENDTDLLYISDSGNTLSGKIFKMEYLKNFSIKFYKALKKINRLIYSKKGARTAFVYSNLVRAGIEIFQEILLMNDYLEYNEDPKAYKIKSTTRCYFCGKPYSEHQKEKISNKRIESQRMVSESSTEYVKPSGKMPEHEFHPATFLVVTGKSSEDSADVIPEEKQFILKNVFSSLDNLDGKHIKLVLGSKVMTEGLSLQFVSEVHILDVYFNLGKVDQVIGRAIRHCSHFGLMSEKNPYPEVNVYKYAVKLNDNEGLSTEEELYKKAELKYLLIKKVERALKESSVDCPLNRTGNVFPEELKIYDNCIEPSQIDNRENMNNKLTCPSLCDFEKCDFRCDSKELNLKYFDEKTGKYRSLNKGELDYTTFTRTLTKNEIESTKDKIKEMYQVKYLYILKDIVNYVRNSYEGEKKELFDEFFVYEALNELTPVTENDFNNFKDIIHDKFGRQGYLIYRDKYYIFQPLDQNENVPMYHRITFDRTMKQQLSLYNYLQNIAKVDMDDEETSKDSIDKKEKQLGYDFDSVMDYYDNRDEFKYVGVIDKESSRRKIKTEEELSDVFKIREKRPKTVTKKRSTGLFSLFGSVCSTSKDKEYLDKIAKELKIKPSPNELRIDICEKIKEKLLFLEKYSTNKKGNKLTYVMIPKNHKEYSFPYNLEDRKNYIVNQLKEEIKFKLDIVVKDIKKIVKEENIIEYIIELKDNSNLKDFTELLKKLNFKLTGNKWILKIE